MQFIKLKSLTEKLTISRATLYRRINEDPKFPKPIKIGRDTVFCSDDVDSYINELKDGYVPPHTRKIN